MLASKALHAPVCASCRLRTLIATKQWARSRRSLPIHRSRSLAQFSTSPRRWQEQRKREELERDFADPEAEEEGVKYAKALLERGRPEESPEKAALMARERYGARLPEGVLGDEALRVYERLYGMPLEGGEEGDEEGGGVALEGEDGGTVVLREGDDGVLEEVEFEEEEGGMEGEDGEVGLEEEGTKEDDLRLKQDMENALSLQRAERGLEDIDPAEEEWDPNESIQRAHPLTAANRFGTSPSTLPLPTASITEPINAQLSGKSNRHLADAAHRTLGGTGLPYGPATPNRAKIMQAKPIQIDAFQHNVSDIEGDVFLAAILPGVYASVMSVLTETRKRLGTQWAESLVQKAQKGELRILDAGGAGAGVLAVREMLRAEWERMHEERSTLDSGMALAEAGGQLGGPGVSPPLGNATVVTGSDVLRHRASKLLENTTFIPRLPDYVHTPEQKMKGKFDLVIAPHTLWGGFRFDRERKTHVQNLWSLLDAEGGVLCLLEKGVSRGFEVVAGAREMLLRTRIKSQGSVGTEFDEDVMEGSEIEWEGKGIEESGDEVDTGKGWKDDSKAATELGWEKEKGTIIAPCTNHSACPMYRPKGFLKGRRDICAFEQRYVRPPFLQRILGAKDKNYEGLQFSYLAVMRGRDLLDEKSAVQDEGATEAAFAGHDVPSSSSSSPNAPPSLLLPRAILPPMKRKGHVLLDLCTPSGTLERWTIPRSFGKQAFRDARKSSWGDLWALGAKTRVRRQPKMSVKHGGRLTKGQRAEVAEMEGGEVVGEKGVLVDEFGRVVVGGKGGGQERGEGGRMRSGRKVGGLRDKRDKSGKGNGRRKMRREED